MIEIRTEDVYEDIRNCGVHMEFFDFSNYPNGHHSGLQRDLKRDKKVPGLMKDQAGGKLMKQNACAFDGRR